jgi:uncharacterized protein YuzE
MPSLISVRKNHEAARLPENSLYIELQSAPGTEVREIVAGLAVGLDANGDVVGSDSEHASRKFDLSRVETIALPAVSAAE